jgi:hypothetical protein
MGLPINRHFDCMKRCQNRHGGEGGGNCTVQCEKLSVIQGNERDADRDMLGDDAAFFDGEVGNK